MERLIVGLSYQGLIQKCLKKVKYKNAWEVLSHIYSLATISNFENCVVVPVPMWNRKERERGFNQAAMIAEMIWMNNCSNSKLIYALERVRNTKPMFGLNRKARIENIKDAFGINHKYLKSEDLKNSIILVDDVWTTGSTMRECANVLKENGAKSVWGITLAR